MPFPFRLRKRKKTEEKAPSLGSVQKEDLQALIAKLKDKKILLSFLGRSGVSQSELDELKKLEEKIIDLLPDELQKKVFGILIKHNIDLLEFLEKDWKDTLRDGYKQIADYLDPQHPLNIVGKKLPIRGKDFLFWILKQAKSVEPAHRYAKISEAVKKGEICGHKVDPSNKELIEKIGMLVGVVLMSKEYSTQFRILMEIMCDIEGGGQFIREELFERI